MMMLFDFILAETTAQIFTIGTGHRWLLVGPGMPRAKFHCQGESSVKFRKVKSNCYAEGTYGHTGRSSRRSSSFIPREYARLIAPVVCNQARLIAPENARLIAPVVCNKQDLIICRCMKKIQLPPRAQGTACYCDLSSMSQSGLTVGWTEQIQFLVSFPKASVGSWAPRHRHETSWQNILVRPRSTYSIINITRHQFSTKQNYCSVAPHAFAGSTVSGSFQEAQRR